MPIIRPVGAMLVETTATLLSESRPARLAGVDDASASKREQHADSTRDRVADRDRRDHGPRLLRETRLVGGPGIDARDLRRGGQHLTDGDHAGATDARHADGHIGRHARASVPEARSSMPCVGLLRALAFALPGLTVMKAGQSPFRQLASTLQLA